MCYLVALGALAPLESLRKASSEICAEIEVFPATDEELRRAFPQTDNVVLVSMRPAERGAAALGRDGLVSRRHTPTAALRQLVRRAATEFGGVRLLVQEAARPMRTTPARSQKSTLAGFLRSGRVVQEDTLLSIAPR